MPLPSHAFVSILAWPRDWDRARMVEALAVCVGIDPYTADLRAAKPTPLAVARLDERPAGAAVRALRDLGVRAYAPTDKQLAGLDRPILAKRLAHARGAAEAMYLVEPWRGEPAGLRMRDAFLIVRAPIATTRSTQTDPATQVLYDPGSGAVRLEPVSAPGRRTTIAEVIELHLFDGQRIRIDGNKFNFDVLGDQRAHADSVNADRLALQLVQQAPRAIVDTGFPAFSPPAGAVRGQSLSPARSRVPEFEFYSAWLNILYRLALAGAGA